MKAHVLDEPELEFRARNRHIDPRYGIAVYGPADADSPSAPRDTPVGLVGPSWAIDGMRAWLQIVRSILLLLSTMRASDPRSRTTSTRNGLRNTRPAMNAVPMAPRMVP